MATTWTSKPHSLPDDHTHPGDECDRCRDLTLEVEQLRAQLARLTDRVRQIALGDE